MCEVGTRGARGLSVGRRRSGSVAPWRRAFTACARFGARAEGRDAGRRGVGSGVRPRASLPRAGRGMLRSRTRYRPQAGTGPQRHAGTRVALGPGQLERAGVTFGAELLRQSYCALERIRWRRICGAGRFPGAGENSYFQVEELLSYNNYFPRGVPLPASA